METRENTYKGLSIDLGALAANWRLLNAQLSPGARCSAVVKANAYGLGAEPVVKRLVKEGCEHFFVANLEEALQIKPLLPSSACLYVLLGCRPGEESILLENNFIPVIISTPMFTRWLAACASHRAKPACAIKVNTGMTRLGMEPEEWQALLHDANSLEQAGVTWLMSHLACADELAHPLNDIQLERFNVLVNETKAVLPECKYCLANSAGVFLGERWHFDMVRPGISLYGGRPRPEAKAIKPVVHLNLEVLQTREAKAGESVGYGATYTLKKPSSLISVAGGYADGISRALGNKMQAVFEGQRIPLVGRVSMDSLIFDVSALPPQARPREGDVIEVLGHNISIDELADKAGTISYEILTALGARYPRRYLD